MQITQSKLLNKFSDIKHGFTQREGGNSVTPYNSLNLAFHVGDSSNTVTLNHQKLANHLDYDYRTLVHMKQIHSNKVHKVTPEDNFENPPTCDALITDKLHIPLMVMVADCSAILFYDTKRHIIAVAHAGRQGAFLNIVQSVMDSFTKDYSSDTNDIVVSIGASIKECCYEVGAEIHTQAQELNLEYSITKRDKGYYLDVSKILKRQLLSAGVLEENIEISDECSCCNSQKYFSYRAHNTTGRFSGVLCLK